jgi:HEPN domain-containing protein
MLPTTREWVSKAEGDYDVVCLLLRSRKRSRYDPICFHAQQCAEKYLKAHLTEAGVAFPKTHDLSVLLDLVAKQIPSWVAMRNDMVALTDWAVLPRYPGTTAGRADARAAVEVCRNFRKVARRAPGLRGK